MALSNCLWCEVPIKHGVARCPECGLQHPSARAVAPRSSRGRARGLTLALLAVPVMLSAAVAAQIKQKAVVTPVPLAPVAVVAQGAPLPAGISHNSIEEAVWTSGQSALRQTLRDPTYAAFNESFVTVSTGRVVTMCGEIKGTQGFDSMTGEERYISVFGQATATVRESQDLAFGVLWNRVCQAPSRAA